MKKNMDDWAALLTPDLPGAISVWSLRGPGSWSRLRQSLFFHKSGMKPGIELPGTSRLARWHLEAGGQGDEVLIIPRGDSPYPWLEIHGHSGPALLRCHEATLKSLGFKLANPSSFAAWTSKDILEAEIARCLELATTNRGVQGILSHGKLLRSALQQLLIEWKGRNSNQLLPKLRRMAEGFMHASGWTTGWKIIICGKPNAGKSSLLNALLGTSRALVSKYPGTTRDIVKAYAVIDGWRIELADTAGWHDASDELEMEGIAIGKKSVLDADLVLWVSDNGEPPPEVLQNSLVIPIWSKSDLLARNSIEPGDFSMVSAVTGQGMEELGRRIVDTLGCEGNLSSGPLAFSLEIKKSLDESSALIQDKNWDAAENELGRWLRPAPLPMEKFE